jgi:hypothetical protein
METEGRLRPRDILIAGGGDQQITPTGTLSGHGVRVIDAAGRFVIQVDRSSARLRLAVSVARLALFQVTTVRDRVLDGADGRLLGRNRSRDSSGHVSAMVAFSSTVITLLMGTSGAELSRSPTPTIRRAVDLAKHLAHSTLKPGPSAAGTSMPA